MKSLISMAMILLGLQIACQSALAADLTGKWEGPQEHKSKVTIEFLADHTMKELGQVSGTWTADYLKDSAGQKHYYKMDSDDKMHIYKVVLPDGSEVTPTFTFLRLKN